MRDMKGFTMAYYGAEQLRPQRQTIEERIERLEDLLLKTDKTCLDQLNDAMFFIGEEVFWIKNITLNWQIKERAVIVSTSKHGIDIKLKGPIFTGPRKIKVSILSIPKHELSKL